jgi:TPR repeat protein
MRPTIPQAPETQAQVDKPQTVTVASADAQAVVPATLAVAAPPPSETAPTPPAPQRTKDREALRLDSEEITVLIKRGNDLLANGDLTAARLVFRRAAEAGSAEGALALGTTFDPVVLHRLGVIGAVADPAQARQWYQRAAELGSSTASQQLAGLAEAR